MPLAPARRRMWRPFAPLTAAMLVACLSAHAAPPIRVQDADGARVAASDDWPMMRHDAQNTGYSPAEVAPPLRLAWRLRLDARPYRAFYPFLLASGGAVCVGTQASSGVEQPEALVVSREGRIDWRVKNAIPVYLKASTLIVAAPREQGESLIQCFDWKARKLKWSHPLGGWLAGFFGAVESGGRLYCSYRLSRPGSEELPWGVARPVLKVLKLEDGTALAERTLEESGWAEGPPAFTGRHLFWGISHWLRALDPETLEPQWGYFDGGNAFPIGAGGSLITQGWGHWVRAIQTEERRRVWSSGAWRGAAHCLARGPEDTPLVVASLPSPQEVAGIEIATGKVAWRYPLWAGGYSANVNGGLAAGSGRVVYLPGWHERLPGQQRRRGGFYCLDASMGTLRWKYERPDTQGIAVIPSEGSVFALATDGFLYRFGPAAAQQVKPGLPARKPAVPGYTLTDLGPALANSVYLSLNNRGEVAGERFSEDADHEAVVWQQGKVRALGPVRSEESYATALNDRGQVVGYSRTRRSTGRALLYRNGQVVDLGNAGGINAQAHDINEKGQIVGHVDTEEGPRAFLYSRGRLTDLNPRLRSVWSNANALNDRGDITGQMRTADGENLAYLYRQGKLTSIGTFGGPNSFATDVNDAGWVVGVAETSTLATRAFLYAGGRLVDLGTLPGYTAAVSAQAINNAGDIVGDAGTGQGLGRAFLYRAGKMFDLNDLIPGDSGWVLGRALDINDRGQIVGQGTRNGQPASFLLTPR